MSKKIPETAPHSPDPKEAPDTDAGEAEIARLINQAAEAQESSRGFMEPKSTAPKRGRGRPKKEPTEEPPPAGPGAESAPPPDPAEQSKQAMRMSFLVASGALVKWSGVPEVALAEQEIAALGDAWGLVIHKWVPEIMNKYGLELAALGITVSVGWRIQSTLAKEIERRKAEQAKEVISTPDGVKK